MAKVPLVVESSERNELQHKSWNVGWWRTVSETRKLIAIIISGSTQPPTNVIVDKSRGKERTELRAQ